MSENGDIKLSRDHLPLFFFFDEKGKDVLSPNDGPAAGLRGFISLKDRYESWTLAGVHIRDPHDEESFGTYLNWFRQNTHRGYGLMIYRYNGDNQAVTFRYYDAFFFENDQDAVEFRLVFG